MKAAFSLEVHVYRPKGCVFPVYRAAALWAVEMQQFTRSPGSDHTQRRRGEFISPHRAFKALRPYPSPRKPCCFTGCLGRRRTWRRDAPTPHSYCTEPKVCVFLFVFILCLFLTFVSAHSRDSATISQKFEPISYFHPFLRTFTLYL